MNKSTNNQKLKQSVSTIILLILSGEAVFILPFVLQRVFRPTFLEVFKINNEQLGYCFSIYGIIALFSYLFGGPLADKFPPKNLMAIALVLTGVGGFYLATLPNLDMLYLLYGYWGFTTIFLFWAAMIKAARIWGGERKQGLAFGLLDGGRGLVAAGFGSLGVLLFSMFIDGDPSQSTLVERQSAFKEVIIYSSVIIITIGLLTYFFLKANSNKDINIPTEKSVDLKSLGVVIKYRSVWLLMIIILCAYTGYKGTDLFALYASDVMHYDAVKSAGVGTALLYIRPIIGIVIGFMADKTKPSLWLIIGFSLSTISSLVFALGWINSETTIIFVLNILLLAIGVYSCRVLYFATLHEGRIPLAITGTAIGLVSIVGYTPDIFSGPLFGILLDNPNKPLGLQHAFLVLVLFSFAGLIASLLFYRHSSKYQSRDEKTPNFQDAP